MPRLVPLLAAAVIATTAVLAHAQKPRAVELTWIAPDGCPSETIVQTEIDRLLGASSSDRRVTATASVTKREDGFRVVLTTQSSGTKGARTLDGKSCPALADATALILALMVDPAAAIAAPASTPLPEKEKTKPVEAKSEPIAATPALYAAPPPPPPLETPIEEAPKPADAPKPIESPVVPSSRSRGVLGASAIADVGALPHAAFGVGLAAAWMRDRLRLEASFAYLPGARVVMADRDAGGDFRLVLGGALGCWSFLGHESGLSLGACGGAEIGRMSASGFGVRAPHSGSATWLAVTSGLMTTYTQGDLALRLQLDAFAPLVRPDFVIDGIGPVHTASFLGFRALIGAEVRFL